MGQLYDFAKHLRNLSLTIVLFCTALGLVTLSNLTIDDTGRVMSRSGGPNGVRLIGFEFTYDGALTYGLFILAAVQLYYCANLHVFLSEIRKASESPQLGWLGLYPNVTALVSALGISVGYPGYVCGLLMFVPTVVAGDLVIEISVIPYAILLGSLAWTTILVSRIWMRQRDLANI